jgi:hypothetical protein
MSRTGSYVWAGALGLLCALFGLRALELLVFGNLNAQNVAHLLGGFALASLCGWGTYKLVLKARASSGRRAPQ